MGLGQKYDWNTAFFLSVGSQNSQKPPTTAKSHQFQKLCWKLSLDLPLCISLCSKFSTSLKIQQRIICARQQDWGVIWIAIMVLLRLAPGRKGSVVQLLFLKMQNQIPTFYLAGAHVATPACDLNAMSKSLSISPNLPPAQSAWRQTQIQMQIHRQILNMKYIQKYKCKVIFN